MGTHSAVALPAVDGNALRWRVQSWEPILGNFPNQNRVIFEWSTGTGPKVFVYPRANRSVGIYLVTSDQTQETKTGEEWADYLEFDFLPSVCNELSGTSVRVDIQCADQKPIQTMRMIRRDRTPHH